MTPEERAEKIVRDIWGYGPGELMPDTKNTIDQLAAQIEQAEREAFANGRLDVQYDADTLPEQIEAYKRKAFSEGFAAAKTKAAFLAHQWADNVYNGNGEMQLVKWIRELAAKIEALEP